MKITRTLTTFKATAYKLSLIDGQAKAEIIGEVEFGGTRATKTDARKAFADAGTPLPKGVEINIVPVRENLYAMDLEKFIEMAVPVETKEL